MNARSRQQSEPAQIPSGAERRDGDLIAAFCSGGGQAALAVMRISGVGAASFVDGFFKAKKRGQCLKELPGYQALFGDIYDSESGEKIDEAVALRFCAPHSYTGEECVELSIHGSQAGQKALLSLVLKRGARLARPGEFTERAFLNGKMDLLQAEAVLELIRAESQNERRAAVQRLDGRLSRVCATLRASLYALLSRLEVAIAYPEYEENEVNQEETDRALAEIEDILLRLLRDSRHAKVFERGLNLALLGAPNAGKSSLLNYLSGCERAIVTEIAGTTRDTIEADLEICGQKIRLIDTAGLRDSSDPVERIGIERSREAARRADLLFWLIEARAEEASFAEDLAAALRHAEACAEEQTFCLLLSKKDLDEGGRCRRRAEEAAAGRFPLLTCSSREEEGAEAIYEYLRAYCGNFAHESRETPLASNERQLDCLRRMHLALRQIREDLEILPPDIVSQALRHLLDLFAELSGECVGEELLETIFSRFCVGK